MSAEVNEGDVNARKVELLRGAGYEDAADLLEAVFAGDALDAKEKAAKEAAAPVKPPGIPLLPGAVFDNQPEEDGRAIRDALERSGIGRPHGAYPMFPNLERGNR